MLRSSILCLSVLLALHTFPQTVSERTAVRLTASVQSSPIGVTLNWVAIGGTTSITIFRKTRSATSWGTAIATPSATALQWTDNSVTGGTYYEYRVARVSNGVTGTGYVSTGIQVSLSEYQGKMILLVDNTLGPQLVTELNQLTYDLRADGWTVIRSDVSRTASVTSVKSIIQGHYNSDPTHVKAVYMVGHVPVPYSGNITPDGHSEGQGARPTDGYYGDMNGTWTDNSVNATNSAYLPARNIPGDGKFDQSDFPSPLELQVGRVDLYDMPAFGTTEVQLIRTYLNKAHNYKIKGWAPTVRALLIDKLEWTGSPLAGSGWRTASLAGSASPSPAAPVLDFFNYANGQSYLWTFHCGGGLQALDGSVVTYNGTSGGATTQQLASSVTMGGAFNMSMGSYFYDWDNRNNFLRALIARGDGLTSVWAGIPAWYFHHMGMGDNIGYSVLQSMNNTGLYTPRTEGWQSSIGRTHMNLMGDPSLRMKMISPPSNLTITNSGGNAAFAWTASAETVTGYHIYQVDPSNGSITRLTTGPIVGTSHTNPSIPFAAGREYRVRAVKLETNFSGSYTNLSLGAIGVSAGTSTGTADCLGVVGGTATTGSACNDNNPCTINDVYNASCQCAGTNITPTASITPAGPLSFCAGASVVLNANTGTGFTYVWKRNGTTISGATSSSFTATQSGTYLATVTNNGCSTTSANTTVNANAPPTATIASAGGTTFCAGGSVVLNANTGTGLTYTWRRDGNSISGATSSSYTANQAGSFTAVISSGGCATMSNAIGVAVGAGSAPTVAAQGPTSFCSGGNVILTTANVAGTSYVWRLNGTAISGATSFAYTAFQSGVFTVATTSGTCTAASAGVTISVPSAPNATLTSSGTTTFCSGGSVNLNANTGSGFTYAWYRNTTLITGATSSSYAATLAGSYTVNVSNGGCSKTSTAIAVIVNARPTVACSAGASPSTVSAVANGGLAPYTYSWSPSAGSSASLTVPASGTYTVVVTDARGCTASCSTTITLPTGTSCAGIRTETQSTWGAIASGSNPAAYLTSNFNAAFPAPNFLTIGCGTRKLVLTSAAAVTAFLPSSGTLFRLPTGTLQNPATSYGNSMAGELVALKLSVRFDELFPTFSSAGVSLKNMLIASGTFTGWTVQQLIDAADAKIGSCGGVYTRPALNIAITAVNQGYAGGTISSGYLVCPSALGMALQNDPIEGNASSPMVMDELLSVEVFPNPAHTDATLVIKGNSAELPTVVEIYSLSGVLVEQRPLGILTTEVQHRIHWNVENYGAGLYLYRVVSGDRIATGKIMVD